jgi:hypothetical protein
VIFKRLFGAIGLVIGVALAVVFCAACAAIVVGVPVLVAVELWRAIL